ncbi:hypothetical protein [Paramagnetospirillum magnetotacticum]|uniref:hypothetical protein n=1 Tax=Paramagnetospirillum magnetotacticum TaxID=188 RepID=UPI001269E645|nr:hypothetical protein [Paramagnetospirillum magnetotacticum]
MKKISLLLAVGALSGCAGKIDYMPPTSYRENESMAVLSAQKDDVWKKLVSNLGKKFFVINNIDKESGLINVSYTGDPEAYVDCGTISSYVKNARGERTYTFPGSKAFQQYEVMTDNLYQFQREMNLEGRVNIVVQEIDKKSTQVQVNTRYILSRKINVTSVQGQTRSISDNSSFNYGSTGVFSGSGQNLQCVSTGKMERDIISLVKN